MKIFLAALALLTIGAARPQALAPQKFVELNPGTYTALGTTVRVRMTRNEDDFPLYRLAIQFPGRKAVQFSLDDHGYQTVPPMFAIGRLSTKGPPVVWVEAFSGGAHCCREPRLIIPFGAGTKVVDLGRWDGDMTDQWPEDNDGDGVRDLVFVDNRFLYTFTSQADSYAPPQIFNVVGDQFVDVSTRPGFRKLYAEWMKGARKSCLNGGRGGCAAYVASAARLGREREAWAEMLRHYDRNFEWDLPLKGCRSTPRTIYDCPAKDEIRYTSYPEALRGFLIQTGYFKR